MKWGSFFFFIIIILFTAGALAAQCATINTEDGFGRLYFNHYNMQRLVQILIQQAGFLDA